MVLKLPNHPLLNKHINNNSKPKLKQSHEHDTHETHTEISIDETFDDDATYIPEDTTPKTMT